MSWAAYHRLDTIYTWLDSLAAAHPDTVKIINIGRSHEGRELRVARVGSRWVPGQAEVPVAASPDHHSLLRITRHILSSAPP